MEGSFSWQMGNKLFLANLWGTVLHGRLIIRSWKGQGSLTNPFSSNLKTVNPKTFVNHEGKTLEEKALTSQQNFGSIWCSSSFLTVWKVVSCSA